MAHVARQSSTEYYTVGGWGGESFVTPPTGKSCFVFVFALRACVRDATRDQGVSRHVFVPAPAPAPSAPAAASFSFSFGFYH